MTKNDEFDLRGINHLAPVCRDMAETCQFYTEVLGMPMIKTVQLPDGGQHFFFDAGGGNSLAFFWFPEPIEAAPGVASPSALIGEGDLRTAVGSMNHIAFDIDPDNIVAYRERLQAKGVTVTEIFNHDNSPTGVSEEMNDDVWIRSIYFFDPNGIMLEFACWTKEVTPADVIHDPASSALTAGA